MEMIKSNEAGNDVYFEIEATVSQVLARIKVLIAEKTKGKNVAYFFRNFLTLFKEVNYFDFIIRQDSVFVRYGISSPPLYIYFNQQDNKTVVQFHLSYFRYMRWALVLTILSSGYFVFDSWKNRSAKESTIIAGFSLLICLLVGLLDWGINRYNQWRFKRYVILIVRDFNAS